VVEQQSERCDDFTCSEFEWQLSRSEAMPALHRHCLKIHDPLFRTAVAVTGTDIHIGLR
jgi:hypothetical protein